MRWSRIPHWRVRADEAEIEPLRSVSIGERRIAPNPGQCNYIAYLSSSSGHLAEHSPRTCVAVLQMRLTTGWMLTGGTIMRKVALAATLLSFALVGSASAHQAAATNPVTGAATGAAVVEPHKGLL